MRPGALLCAAALLVTAVGCDPTLLPVQAQLAFTTEIDGTGSAAWDFTVDANAAATREDPIPSLFAATADVSAYLEACPECATSVSVTTSCGDASEAEAADFAAGAGGLIEASVDPLAGCASGEPCSRQCRVEVAAEGDLYVAVDLVADATVWVGELWFDEADLALEVAD